MFWDVFFALLGAIAQAITAWLGWRVTIDGVRPARKQRYEYLFALGAVIGIGSIGITSYRGSMVAKELHQIEENTKQPPIVNLPAPAPVALIAFEKLEDIYRLYINGVPSGAGVGLVAGKSVGFNVYFVNTGTTAAHNVRGYGRVYLVGDNKHESSVITRFKKELESKRNDPLKATLDAGGHDEHWFTAQSDRAITQDDLNRLAKGTEYIYLLFSESYSDSSASHEQHYCKLLQPPAFDPEVWQLCKDFSDRH